MASNSSAAVGNRKTGDSFRLRRGGLPHGGSVPGFAAGALTVVLAALAVLLAACGGAQPGYHAAAGGATGASNQAAASHAGVVTARSLPGVGTILVSRSGRTIYSPKQEADGKIMCTGSCLSFWFPVAVAPGAVLRAPNGITGVLGEVHRADDGLHQLTYNGKPLYTFRLDQAPGQAHGNNFTDHFGGASFTWHAVTISGALAGQGQPGGHPSQGAPPGY